MTTNSDKDVKATAIEALSRLESSPPAGKPIKDHGIPRFQGLEMYYLLSVP